MTKLIMTAQQWNSDNDNNDNDNNDNDNNDNDNIDNASNDINDNMTLSIIVGREYNFNLITCDVLILRK